jgi:hypothetical protein
MFGLKRIEIGNFGNGLVPKFNITELNIRKIQNNVDNTRRVENTLQSQPQPQPQQNGNKKQLKTSGEIFAAINRRFNKFKYAYYNKGVHRMDKEKINRCYEKTKKFLNTLRHMHQRLIASGDPRAERFGKKVEEANVIVQKYGAYVMRLNQANCKKIPQPNGVNRNRNKVRR